MFSIESIHPSRWETGSEFHWQDFPMEHFVSREWPAAYRLFATGRGALIAVGAIIAEKTGHERPRLHLPSFFCMGVARSLRPRFDLHFFPDMPGEDGPNLAEMDLHPGDMVLAVNFFGLRDGKAWLEFQDRYPDVWVIEDHTHDPLSRWAGTSKAPYVFSSLRKTLPIPDGAMVSSPRGLQLPEPHLPACRGADLKLQAMLLKKAYLEGASIDKEAFRRLQLQGENALERSTLHRATIFSHQMLCKIPASRLRSIRERNVKRVLEKLREMRKPFRPLFPSWPEGAVPYNPVLVCDNETIRNDLLKYLISNHVYASVHWPLVRSGGFEPDAEAMSLSRRILTLPTDHRYGEMDIDHICELLNRFPRGTISPKSPVARQRIFLSPPHMTGRESVLVDAAFASNFVAPSGPMVDRFEQAFVETTAISHAVAVTSGTAAMHLALRSLGVGPGDMVFLSTLTFIGSVSPTVFLGATPVFLDADPSTWNMDVALLARGLEEYAEHGCLPKAVIPTDLYGQCNDLDAILEICSPYGIPVITDSAEALGATYKGRSAGKGARAAVFSFNGNKIVTTSGGGMLASDDRQFIDYTRFLSQQAREPTPYYQHKEIGYNYRMSNILAAVGLGQIEAIEEKVARKRQVFQYYRHALKDMPGISWMPEAPYGKSNRWLTVILVDPAEFGRDRDFIRKALNAANIESRPMWKPMHLQPAFHIISNKSDIGVNFGKWFQRPYPALALGGAVSEDLFAKGLCLPSGTSMSEADLDHVIKIIKSCKI